MDKIEVFAPATIANLGPGIDIFGLAIDKPGDVLKIKKTTKKGLVISKIFGDDNKLPYDIETNTCGIVAKKLIEHFKYNDSGFEMELYKQMPIKSGLGSSAASSVAAAFGINKLIGEPLTKEQLIMFALEGEKIACGSAHADNVAPCMLGGFVVVRSYNPLDVFKVETDLKFKILLIHPKVDIPTEISRRVMKKNISFKEHLIQNGNSISLAIGLMKNDIKLISRSLVDIIVEPIRSLMIPKYNEIKEILKANNCFASNISGSGPSIFGFFENTNDINKAKQEISNFYNNLNIESDLYITQVNYNGVDLI